MFGVKPWHMQDYTVDELNLMVTRINEIKAEQKAAGGKNG